MPSMFQTARERRRTSDAHENEQAEAEVRVYDEMDYKLSLWKQGMQMKLRKAPFRERRFW